MRKSANRNRVQRERLWDDQGRLWLLEPIGQSPEDVPRLINQSGRVVLHGDGRPLRWLAADEARDIWHRVTQEQASPDARPYDVEVWRSGNDLLLGFAVAC